MRAPADPLTSIAAALGQYNSPLLKEQDVLAIAEAHGVTAGQILLAFDTVRGISVVPKSSNPGRLAQNLAAADIKLTEDELNKLLAIHKQPGKYTSLCDYGSVGTDVPGQLWGWKLDGHGEGEKGGLGWDYEITRGRQASWK